MAPQVNNVSSQIVWQVIRNNSCFLKRQRGILKHFSFEPYNTRKLNSIRHNGLLSKKGVNVQVRHFLKLFYKKRLSELKSNRQSSLAGI